MKNQFLKRVLFGLLVASSALFGACSDDDSVAPLAGQEGFFVINEGGFGNGDASLSYFDKATNTMINDVFFENVERPLGDQAQSMSIYNGNGYIVVQNSGKIEVINAENFGSLGTINKDAGIVSPRYFLGIDQNKGYVTDWGADGVTGTVKVVDLNALEVTKTIDVGQGPNEMVRLGNKVYVANNGGWGYDNKVVIIDVNTDQVVGSITVGDNPSALKVDRNNNIWVTGSGKTVYNADWSVDEANSTPAFLAKIVNDEVALKLDAASVYAGLGRLVMNNAADQLYFNYSGAVYTMSIDATELPASPFIDKSFYGLSVDPSTDNVIGTEAPNYSSAGTVYRYDNTGKLIDQYTAGIAPNGCAFK
ncbi:hypothetical protein GCM10009122_09480 [Fulvivirga kasyanovii]|uniref:YncE family protein n=1 Tax=Fulvivirga kasyanovii TaxID=396812 RepID=A0ABW9RLU2_9BACT|nr:DUF5074 domain-containing protein [Fulvivirga kasyanovii]MTI25087.1 hypothetical protein [Fulvivirga kasyanovii]